MSIVTGNSNRFKTQRSNSISSNSSSDSQSLSINMIDDYEIDPLESTNLDAAQSKASTVEAGYLKDQYISHMVHHPERRLPIIHRGTFVRTFVVDTHVRAFIRQHGTMNTQIVSIGAGWDTRWFILEDDGLAPLSYFEIDFENTLQKKKKRLSRYISKKSTSEHQLHLVPGDLNNLSEIIPKLISLGFDINRPTLILSEIVLVYLDADQGNKIIKWFCDNLVSQCTFLVFEHTMPTDPFGEMMLKNLHERGILLKSIMEYPTVKKQQERYLQLGFKSVLGFDLGQAYDQLVPHEEKLRISKLEILDELEEWILLCSHYCFIIATV